MERSEVALDRCFSRADKLNQNVGDLVDVARFGLEDTKRELNESLGGARVRSVNVLRIRPEGAAQPRLVRPSIPRQYR